MKNLDPKLKVKRQPQMGVYDPQTLKAILKVAPFCHVGFIDDGSPVVIPMAFVSTEEKFYLHGSTQSRLMKTLAAGSEVSITVTLYDGLVLAKSAFNHSMNYRSVSIFGVAKEINEVEGKISFLKALSDKYVPGRWEKVRFPSDAELKSVMVLELPLEKMSGKVRAGPPDDLKSDLDHPVWSGVVPYKLSPLNPEADPASKTSQPIPQNILELVKNGAL